MPVNVIGTLKPKNNGKFPVAEAVDIKVKDDLRLDKALENKADLATVNFALAGKADNSDINDLQSQINEIITPVTQDAEVQNARVGADGTSYQTLKSRLDEEYKSTNEDIRKLGYATVKITTSGSVHSSTIDQINFTIDSGKTYTFTVKASGSFASSLQPFVYYSGGNQQLGSITIGSDGTGKKSIVVPENLSGTKVGFYIASSSATYEITCEDENSIFERFSRVETKAEQVETKAEQTESALTWTPLSSETGAVLSTGGNLTPNNRIKFFGTSASTWLPIKKGDIFNIDASSDIDVDFNLHNSNGTTSGSGWIATPTSYTANDDGAMELTFRHHNESAFDSVEYMDGKIHFIRSGINSRIDTLFDSVGALQGISKEIADGVFYDGYDTITNGTPLSAGNEYAVRSPLHPCKSGDLITITTDRPLAEGRYYAYSFIQYDASGTAVSQENYNENRTDNTFRASKSSCAGFRIALVEYDAEKNIQVLRKADFENYKLFFLINEKLQNISSEINKIYVPDFETGSINNTANANAITIKNIVPTYGAKSLRVTINKDAGDGFYYDWQYRLFNVETGVTQMGASGYDASTVISSSESFADAKGKNSFILNLPSNCKGYAIGLFKRYVNDDSAVTIQTKEYMHGSIAVARVFVDDATISSESAKTLHLIKNARKVSNTANQPISILHFSDLHGDQAALDRIMSDAEYYGTEIDDIICTGDIVPNTAVEIESWWDPSVLTCIGNHDSASYSEQTGYDWTALSMADRDAYYIEPFEGNWNIEHNSGTSYYYKDYDGSKLRLIVLDAMLYSDVGEETEDQTTWLGATIDNAMSNEYHVLIAVHAPHGGSIPVPCSFTEYDAPVMPTYTDCNLPTSVIELVSSKISNGLSFAGYIVGHIHRDRIYDATGDGTQMIYAITCAAVAQTAQWQGSDQHRSNTEDAYNIVTVDTTRKMVKIIRGGGADVDNIMRSRRMICIDYSTGTVISEHEKTLM
jgi:hypothetical protein